MRGGGGGMARNLEEELGTENVDDYRKQWLCSKLEQLVMKLDSAHAALIQIVKSDFDMDWMTTSIKTKDYHRSRLKQYHQTAESEDQT